jgi:hypothetical protein
MMSQATMDLIKKRFKKMENIKGKPPTLNLKPIVMTLSKALESTQTGIVDLKPFSAMILTGTDEDIIFDLPGLDYDDRIKDDHDYYNIVFNESFVNITDEMKIANQFQTLDWLGDQNQLIDTRYVSIATL